MVVYTGPKTKIVALDISAGENESKSMMWKVLYYVSSYKVWEWAHDQAWSSWVILGQEIKYVEGPKINFGTQHMQKIPMINIGEPKIMLGKGDKRIAKMRTIFQSKIYENGVKRS